MVIENANEGIDTVIAGISYTLGNNLENLTLMAPGQITNPEPGYLHGTGNASFSYILRDNLENLVLTT